MAEHDGTTNQHADPAGTARAATDDATAEVDRHDAKADHVADRPPTDEEAAHAPDRTSDEVKAAYRESIERGAGVQGEGQITPEI